jgi:hypothetical protein
LALFSSIQKGLEQSPHPGILGRCEERLHAFQSFMQRQSRQTVLSTATRLSTATSESERT